MATHTPPPYFPQSSLSPPDPKRYLKFRLMVAAIILGLLGIGAGIVIGVIYLLKRVL